MHSSSQNQYEYTQLLTLIRTWTSKLTPIPYGCNCAYSPFCTVTGNQFLYYYRMIRGLCLLYEPPQVSSPLSEREYIVGLKSAHLTHNFALDLKK